MIYQIYNHFKSICDNSEMTHVKSGVLDGKPVTVLMDTGSHMSVVRAGRAGRSMAGDAPPSRPQVLARRG